MLGRFRLRCRFHLFGGCRGGGSDLSVGRGSLFRSGICSLLFLFFFYILFFFLLLLAGYFGEVQGREQSGDVPTHVELYACNEKKLINTIL